MHLLGGIVAARVAVVNVRFPSAEALFPRKSLTQLHLLAQNEI